MINPISFNSKIHTINSLVLTDQDEFWKQSQDIILHDEIKQITQAYHSKYWENSNIDTCSLAELIHWGLLSDFYYVILDFCKFDYINHFMFVTKYADAIILAYCLNILYQDEKNFICSKEDKNNLAKNILESDLSSKYSSIKTYNIDDLCIKIMD
jgi:hypothetical protein